ncbi:TIGR00341 family protein [Salarchaeum sp. JOR-1]|uniref:TIGR00341 family protein n=1 Tax=Salarchaeum sp. JOR-1 TaxID=2599399 RepID=UPI001198B8ED|nr:TIGR00341 family protein [Salarchaeum sp. JOR-1]QDX40017.1 TIGR00341 family protein [Salarchaeum sp. JOR-1]
MRLIQVTIPAGKRNAVLGALDDEGVDYVVTEEASGREYTAVVYFPLPTNAVEPVLDVLGDAGLDEDAYTVVIDAETVVSRRFEELRERYEKDEETESEIATAELKSTAEEFASNWRRYLTLTVVSAVIAAAGVLLDSAVVVVGANVIIPLMDPAMAASVGTVVRDRDLFVKGVRRQVAGLVAAVASAAAFAFLAKTIPLVPPDLSLLSLSQVRSGMTANALSLVVALGAGVAGAVTLVSGVASTLVGVAIAVALVPPAATMGIGIAWGNPAVVVGAGVLLLVNMLSINLAALVVIWQRGYRPKSFFETDVARETVLKRISVLVVGILVLSTFVGAVTLGTIHRASFEQHVGATVDDALAEEPYDELVRLDVRVRYEREPLFRAPSTVVVTVGTPTNATYRGLADRLADRLSDRVSGSAVVHVRFIELETARVT